MIDVLDAADSLVAGPPYVSYAYSYPHKTAYRPFDMPIPLAEAWAEERREALFLYLHIPFCEMRCGFCNLFTIAHPQQTLERRYLDTLHREAVRVREAVGPVRIARMAIGGGTPTFLEPDDLDAVFRIAYDSFGADPHQVPASVETSPATATPERLAVLRQHGVERVSIGVQSFFEPETAAIGRGQKRNIVETALANIRASGIPTLNIDLIYGAPGQTRQSWAESLRAALAYEPEELYLYPLYVRPLTGLGNRRSAGEDEDWDEMRLALYRVGRDLLLAEGYEQVSMRMFRRVRPRDESGPVYCCQDDGMIGLGCGARSYTRALHYSREYAVGRSGVRAILEDYVAKDDASFGRIDYGIALDREEQVRRYAINMLLQAEGLDLRAYEARFGTPLFEDLPQIARLLDLGLAGHAEERIVPTILGLERSDAIGPWLSSDTMRRRMEAFELR